MEEEKGGERDTWRIGIRAKRQLPFQGWNATVCHGLTLEGWLHFPRYSDLTVSQTWYPVILYPFAYSSSTLFDSPIRRCFPFPACLSASPLFLLFFFPPSFLARVCTKRENFKLEKPRSENKGRDDAWEEENKDPLLFPSPAALLHSRCSPLCDEAEVSRYKIRRGRGGRRWGGRRWPSR